jgi:putative ABC transport system ATP-binding protein
MINISNVTKKYSSTEWEIRIFENMSLAIPQWSFVAIMWPSWSWKSTLLNLLSGLDKPNEGTIRVADTAFDGTSDDAITSWRWKHISFIFQAFHLLPHLTVEENINLSLQLNNLERRYSTDEILEKVGLSDRKKAYPFTLSGWEQQRVAIARAFVWQTPILLADEPTWNLDENTAQRIIDLIASLHKDTWTTIVMITHDDRIAQKAQVRYRLHNHNLHLVS